MKLRFSWKRALIYFGIFLVVTTGVYVVRYFLGPPQKGDIAPNDPVVMAVAAWVPFFVSFLIYIIARKGFLELIVASLLTGGGQGIAGCLVSFIFSIPTIWITTQIKLFYGIYIAKK
jgi:hypothetical protein